MSQIQNNQEFVTTTWDNSLQEYGQTIISVPDLNDNVNYDGGEAVIQTPFYEVHWNN